MSTLADLGPRARRVLLVDDHLDTASSIGRLLNSLGYEVCVALDGHDALYCAARFQPDVALVDLSLPGVDGFGVAEAMRGMRETRATLLIAMTGWSADAVSDQVRAAGFDLQLLKPVSLDALTRALETARA
jgi:CheY-like chemotaxis protein